MYILYYSAQLPHFLRYRQQLGGYYSDPRCRLFLIFYGPKSSFMLSRTLITNLAVAS